MTRGSPIRLAPAPAAPGLNELVTAVRRVVGRHADWRETARLVADDLTRHLSLAGILKAEQRIGDPENYRSHVLGTEPDGAFSIVALAWHGGGEPDPRSCDLVCVCVCVCVCVFRVIQGV
jgi:3-mercaptopropionate dioxygenase